MVNVAGKRAAARKRQGSGFKSATKVPIAWTLNTLLKQLVLDPAAAKGGPGREANSAGTRLFGKQLQIPPLAGQPEQTDHEVVEPEEFKGKGQIAEVTEQGHLEEVEEIHEGNAVLPLGVGPEIPQFPKAPADQAARPQRQDRTPVAGLR